jgi:hypothetical protein
VKGEHQRRRRHGRRGADPEAQRWNRRRRSLRVPEPKRKSDETDRHDDDREPWQRHLAGEIGTGERLVSEHDQIREIRSRQ